MAVTLVVLSGSVLAPDGVAITSGHIRAKLSQPGSTLDGAVSQRVATEANGTITAGVVAMSIVPNDAITPSGTYYVAVYDCKAANGKAYRWSEKWQLTSDDLTLDIGAVPRLEVVPGVSLEPTLVGVQAQADAAASSEAAAIAAENAAEIAQAAAEAARDAAIIQSGVYVDEPTGRAAVANGVAFKVQGSGDVAAYEYRRVDAGSSTLIATYPSSAAVQALADQLPQTSHPAYSWTLRDEMGHIPMGVLPDGTVEFKALSVPVVLASESVGTASAQMDETLAPGFSWSVRDAEGRVALGVLLDGTVVMGEATAQRFTETAPAAAATEAEPVAELNFINNTGQSLGEGSNGTVTSVQEYDNIGFAARASAPVAYVTLTVANTEAPTSRGESPMYGAAGRIKEQLAAENPSYGNYQLLACNNAYSGYRIDQLKKGTTPYTNAMAQLAAAVTIAQSESRICHQRATLWTQGESDGALSRDEYQAALRGVARDFATDIMAATGQAEAPILICCQTGTGDAGDITDQDVALAQLDATIADPLVVLACPMYQFDYYDALHITAASSKWLGGYYGAAYKRVVIDGAPWVVVRPISHAQQGAVLNLRFAVPVMPLVLDTSNVPAQTNYGFSLVDSGGSPLTISSVSVVGQDVVKIVAASTIPAGAEIRYGWTAASGKGTYLGGCGNLRDSNTATYAAISKPLYNWSMIFKYSL